MTPSLVAALFAVDPVGLGGVVLRSGAGAARDDWLAALKSLLPAGTPWRRVPLHVDEDRLLGGLDLAATLRTGRPVAQRGLLAEADGGIALLAMAERLGASTAASVAAAIDRHELMAERHGTSVSNASRIGVVALDEGIADDERVPASLRERLAFVLDLNAGAGRPGDDDPGLFTADDVAAARERFAVVRLPDAVVEGLCAASLALGIDSVRAPMLACRVARASAALDGRGEANARDAALAAALVLAPRATRVPAASASAEKTAESGVEDVDKTAGETADEDVDETAPGTERRSEREREGGSEQEREDRSEPDAQAKQTEPENSPQSSTPNHAGAGSPRDDFAAVSNTAIDEVVLEAALASIPPGLLAMLARDDARSTRVPSAGRVGAARLGTSRGRPTGVRRGEPQRGARLALTETLRAAAPWQALRRREADASGRVTDASGRITDAHGLPPVRPHVLVRREDFHVWRFKQRSETTTVFVVDASGSAALHRLAEAKGAVELLLADCYVRRDSVAVIAFRGNGAEVLLPPTRSLVRARRSLAGLPGGGGTPLAAGIATARTLADAARRKGATPVVVLLTDGRANIALDGSPGRARAGDDALAAARQMRLKGFATLVLDTSPQAQEPARRLAAAMGARYLPLPHAGAAVLSQAVLSQTVRAAGA